MDIHFRCRKVNFESLYLEFCWDFVQHIYTRSKGFLVSFSMMVLNKLSDLQFLNKRQKCRKISDKTWIFQLSWTSTKFSHAQSRRQYDYGNLQRSPFLTKKQASAPRCPRLRNLSFSFVRHGQFSYFSHTKVVIFRIFTWCGDSLGPLKQYSDQKMSKKLLKIFLTTLLYEMFPLWFAC